MASLRSPLCLLLRIFVWNQLLHESLCWISSHCSLQRGRIHDFQAPTTSGGLLSSVSFVFASSTNDNDADALSQALARSHPTQTLWYANTGLPFECTECGKCCKTQGSVYMNPSDIEQASDILDMTRADFIEKFASRILSNNNDNVTLDDAWIRLKNNNEGSCVFLSAENQCMIYQARPVQCSTYPFWPKIMESKQAWNDEVRIPDDIVLGEKDDFIPYWTAHEGGCEGMSKIGNDARTVVSPYQAHYQLMEYERAEQSFPKEAIVRRVKRKQRD